MTPHQYINQQVDLACLDTMHGDYSEYGLCLRFAMERSALHAVRQMFDANGALTFESRDPETWEEREERWAALYEQRAA